MRHADLGNAQNSAVRLQTLDAAEGGDTRQGVEQEPGLGPLRSAPQEQQRQGRDPDSEAANLKAKRPRSAVCVDASCASSCRGHGPARLGNVTSVTNLRTQARQTSPGKIHAIKTNANPLPGLDPVFRKPSPLP